MRALELQGSELRFRTDYPIAEVPAGSTRVNVIQAGICETDLQLIAGYMGFSGVLGHEFVGVAESGKFAGQRVVGEINCVCGTCEMCSRGLGNHCPNRSVIGILNHDGAFADSLIVPENNLHAVPDSMSNDLATLVEPVAAAMQIPEQVSLPSETRAAVVGDGRLGNLCAQVLRNNGCEVLVVGKHEPKLAAFASLEMKTCLLTDVATHGRSFDVVVDCAGSSSGLQTALGLVRPRGTIVMKTTVAGEHQTSLASIVIDEINLIGSRCGPFGKAIDAISQNRFELTNFVSGRFAIENYEAAFQRAQEKDTLKVVIKMNNSASN